MEFGLSGAIQLAISLLAGRRPASWSQISCEPVCDQVRAISTCRNSSNLSATGQKPGLRPARELVADMLANCQRTGQHLIGQIPLLYPARQQLASMSQTSSRAGQRNGIWPLLCSRPKSRSWRNSQRIKMNMQAYVTANTLLGYRLFVSFYRQHHLENTWNIQNDRWLLIQLIMDLMHVKHYVTLILRCKLA